MVTDTVLHRTELSSFNDVLYWADDGSIAVNTIGELVVFTPKYNKDEIIRSNDLFELNKIDIGSFPLNDLYQSETPDEKVSTAFTSADTSIVKLCWSPLINQSCILTVLTNHHSLILLKNNEVWKDLTSTEVVRSQAEFEKIVVHSFTWIEKESSLYLVTGLASGDVKSFKLTDNEISQDSVLNITDNPIVRLESFGKFIIAVSNSNEIFHIDGNSVKLLNQPQRHLIYDVLLTENNLIHIQLNKLVKTSFGDGSQKSVETGIYSHSKIVPSGSDVILISDSESKKVTYDLTITKENIVDTVLSKRLAKWNSKYNDFNTKNFILKTYGSAINYSGNVLAVLYEIYDDDGFKYKISSQNIFKIAYIPLSNNFITNCSSFATYQEYKLVGSFHKNEVKENRISFEDSFDDYLKKYVIGDSLIKELSTQNLLTRDQDSVIRNRFANLILQYVENKGLIFENKIDHIVLNNLSLVAGRNIDEYRNLSIEFKGGAFKETFDFQNNNNLEILKSTTGHIWPRCSLSFLPILTPLVKIDMATEKRIIDIDRDVHNEYGPFTKSILNLSEVSIYSGSPFKMK